jgi:hypothetical protein
MSQYLIGLIFFYAITPTIVQYHVVDYKGSIAQSDTLTQKIELSEFESREPQPSEWIELLPTPEKKDEVNLGEYDLYSLNRMTGNGNGLLAFLDYEDEKIVIIDGKSLSESFFFRKIGGEPGSKESQFGNTFDLKFSSENEIIVADLTNAQLSKWKTDGQFSGILSLEKIVPSRLSVCEDGSIYLLLQNYQRRGLIARIDPSTGKTISIFQKISRFDLQSVFHRDGAITCHGSDLLYSAYYDDFIKRYQQDGEVQYSKKLMGFEPNEKLVLSGENEEGMFIRRNPDARRSVGEMVVLENRLYVGFSGNQDMLMRRIDIYNPASGVYMGTIPIPEPFEEFVIDSTGLYILTPPRYDDPPRLIRYWLPK